MERKISILTIFLLVLIPVISFAAGYSRTITVSKAGGSFDSPVKALGSITSASADSPVLVKVLAGTYDLGTKPLQMKDHVDLEGEGINKTIITSSISSPESNTCFLGAVVMAMNSSIKNLTVVNTSRENIPTNNMFGVVFDNVKARAEGIQVKVGSGKVTTRENYGICVSGPASNATLTKVAVEVRNLAGSSGAIGLYDDGNASIFGSKLMSFSGQGDTRGIDCRNSKENTGKLVIENSQVEGTVLDKSSDNPSGNRGLDVRVCGAMVADTVVTLVGGDTNIGIEAAHNPVRIDKSKIFSPGEALRSVENLPVTISNSVIQGRLPQDQGVNLTNNTDHNGKPIADR